MTMLEEDVSSTNESNKLMNKSEYIHTRLVFLCFYVIINLTDIIYR